MNKTKRFISGAVCPACQEVDRTVIEPVDTEAEAADINELPTQAIRRRCVACGFTEALDPEKITVTAPLPRARYEKSRQTTTKIEAVRILDPTPSKSS